MWEVKDTSGGIHDVGDIYKWDDAFEVFLATLNTEPCFAGHCDWRIPNAKELQSLVDYSAAFPSISEDFPGETAPEFYWTSTTFGEFPLGAFFVGFNAGDVFLASKQSSFRIRAVRGGR